MREHVTFQSNKMRLTGNLAILALLFALLSNMAGHPSERSLGFFYFGIALTIVITLGYGYLVWHLMWRPLPEAYANSSTEKIAPHYQQLLGTLILIAMINMVIGGMWDEAWHRKYGIPFGEDLFWRPHLMLYEGFGFVILLAFGGIWYVIRNSRGSLQQRFRSNSAIGLGALLGGYLLYALPADPLWHIIYGEDISAWSLPHLTLLLSIILIGSLALTMVMTNYQLPATIRPINFQADLILASAAFAGLLTVCLIVLITEWDSYGAWVESYFIRLGRPDWLLPIVLGGIAAWLGLFSTFATRRFGLLTISAILALVLRMTFTRFIVDDNILINGWLTILPPLLCLDGWLAIQSQRRKTPTYLSSCIAIFLGLLVGSIPLINSLYQYPNLGWQHAIPILIFGALTILLLGWVGMQTGQFVVDQATVPTEETDTAVAASPLRLVAPIAFVSMIVFIAFFILTASPPV